MSLYEYHRFSSSPEITGYREKVCDCLSRIVGFARCHSLIHLSVCWKDVLRVVGRNLVHLELWEMSVDGEAIDVIIEYCPNLQYLEVKGAARGE
jgi:hypothetical protein